MSLCSVALYGRRIIGHTYVPKHFGLAGIRPHNNDSLLLQEFLQGLLVYIECIRIEENESDELDFRMSLQVINDGPQGNVSGLFDRVSINPGTDGWKGDGVDSVLGAQFQAFPISACQEVGIFGGARISGPHGVDDVFCLEMTSTRNHCRSGWAALILGLEFG